MGFALVTIPTTFGTGGSGLNPTSDATKNLQNILTQLTGIVGIGNQNPEEISSSGALSVTNETSRMTVSGTKAYTLPDGTFAGQWKRIYVVSAASTPAGTITPAHANGFSTIVIGAGSATSTIDLQWDSSVTGWKVVGQTIVGTVTIS